ncbi:hypothetical protein [Cohnella fermenti]|uniref:Uncharacterized protein n=1 Tax=Cohnella fermenti TaxID=2565925 RepID=A0A4S4BM74_9BACL|nr:hypothetical protein [Cohnella fermenti]THF75880.1 hypothetical protein E6C55_20465 [Cohnella fermenti]
MVSKITLYWLLLIVAIVVLWHDWRGIKGRNTALAYSAMYAISLVISFIVVYDRRFPGPVLVLNKLFEHLNRLLFR